MQNYYDILGIDKTASSQEVKQAYESLKSELRFKFLHRNRLEKLEEAYSVLIDADKRTKYDSEVAEALEKQFQDASDALHRELSMSELKAVLEVLEECVQKNHPGSMFVLGQLYAMGRDIPPDYEKAMSLANKSIELGYVRANLLLAVIYSNGLGVAVDLLKAEQCLRVMAESGDADGYVELARFLDAYYPYQRTEECYQLLEKAIELGRTDMIEHLILVYGSHCDDEKAAYWLDRAEDVVFNDLDMIMYVTSKDTYLQRVAAFAKSMIDDGQFEKVIAFMEERIDDLRGQTGAMLVQIYSTGLGDDHYGRDLDKAAALFKRLWNEENDDNIREEAYRNQNVSVLSKLSDEGDALAMYEIAKKFQNGDGVPVSMDEAESWWIKAAENGCIRADHDLGVYYALEKGKTEEGLLRLNKAASSGYTQSLLVLGHIYLFGKGVDVDVDKSIALFSKADELGDSQASWELSCLYRKGGQVEKDMSLSKSWFEKYCSYDTAHGHFMKGMCYYEGDLYSEDLVAALEEFKIAAESGYHDANPYYYDLQWKKNISTPYSFELSRDSLINVYERLASQGDPEAMYILYMCYSDNTYNKRDLEMANYYLRKSEELGYQPSNILVNM